LEIGKKNHFSFFLKSFMSCVPLPVTLQHHFHSFNIHKTDSFVTNINADGTFTQVSCLVYHYLLTLQHHFHLFNIHKTDSFVTNINTDGTFTHVVVEEEDDY